MQIYLETEQRLRLAALARAQGRPAAELIREAIERYLREGQKSIATDDGLMSLVGAAGELETAHDVSTHHHRYLAVSETPGAAYASRREAPGEKPKAKKSVRRRRKP
jgi:hypothetical protein